MTATATNDKLMLFGFELGRAGVHSSRTIMLKELEALFTYVPKPGADQKEYIQAIRDDNCLGKRSGKNRILTAKYLINLYSLDTSVIIFRALRYFWQRDEEGHQILALLCAFSRDAILRLSAPFILSINEGESVPREMLEEYIEKKEAERFSKATLKSTAQNINSTWTKTGHLIGRIKKYRSKALATPGGIAYALLLSYLLGSRGEALFQSEYLKLLDCSTDHAMQLAEVASRRGWIIFKRIEKVIEVSFPNIMTAQEMEWIREQYR